MYPVGQPPGPPGPPGPSSGPGGPPGPAGPPVPRPITLPLGSASASGTMTTIVPQATQGATPAAAAPAISGLLPPDLPTFVAPRRPNLGREGKQITLRANHFQITMPRGYIHHYDVSIQPDKCPRKVNREIIETMVHSFPRIFGNLKPVFDGRSNLYTRDPLVHIGNEKMELEVLPSISQDEKSYAPVFIQHEKNSEEFFVFKRRKLDGIAGEDKINKLTEEVLLMIFKWLPKYMLARCAQVCRRWKRLALDESLWRRLDLGSKTLNPGVVGRVLLRGTFTLRLAKAEISSPIFCPQLQYLQGYPHISCRIQNLDLSMAAISPEALCELFSVCFELRKVSLEHCTLNEECCIHLSNNFELDTLNLAMCYGLSSDGLLSILTCCPKLQALNLAWTNLGEKDLMDVCENLPPSLLRLNLSGCRHTMTESHVRQLVQSAPSLLELDLSDASQITTVTIATIIKRLSHLEYLALSRCFSITPTAYLGLVAMKNLLYLDVYGSLNEKALIMVKENLPDIKINKYLFSSVARPTVGIRRTSIWSLRVRG